MKNRFLYRGDKFNSLDSAAAAMVADYPQVDRFDVVVMDRATRQPARAAAVLLVQTLMAEAEVARERESVTIPTFEAPDGLHMGFPV